MGNKGGVIAMNVRKKIMMLFIGFGLSVGFATPTQAMWSALKSFFGATPLRPTTQCLESTTKNNDSEWESFDFNRDEISCGNKRSSLPLTKIGENDVRPVYVGHYQGKEIVQLPVKSQFGSDGGGGASCGYQAVKNGIEMVLALSGKDVPDFVKQFAPTSQWKKERPEHLNGTLNDAGLITTLFGGECGTWRQLVVKERIFVQLKNKMMEDWRSCVHMGAVSNNLDPEKVKNFYKSTIDALTSQCAYKILDGVVQKDPMLSVIRNKALEVCAGKKQQEEIDAYYLETHKNNTVGMLQDDLCSEQMVKQCVDVEKMKLPQLSDIEDVNWQWIDGDHMQTIMKYECQQGVLKGIHDISYVVCDDCSLLGTEFDPNQEVLTQAVQHAAHDPRHKVLFCIGNMHNSRESGTGTCGHWYSMVWTKDRCYTMDSARDNNRVNDDNIKKIIDFFEQRVADVIKTEKGSALTHVIKDLVASSATSRLHDKLPKTKPLMPRGSFLKH